MARKPTRHTFNFKVRTNDGETRVIAAKAKMIKATKPVELILTADDVRRSMKLGGVGNSQTCSMAVCAKRQASAFPHPVDGYIDWMYSRAYVVTKVSKQTGMPIECVCYIHTDDIAKWNDTKGGQRKMLAELEASGPRTIKLLPVLKRKAPPKNGRPEGKKDGSRTSRGTYGAARRFAYAQLGGVA